MKLEKISLMGHAIELTKLARGPVSQMPAVTADASGNIILSAQQELENRVCWAIFTEFYDALSRAENDETVFHDPLDESALVAAHAASPAAVVAQAAQVVAAAAPVIAAANPATAAAATVASTVASALSAALSKPIGS